MCDGHVIFKKLMEACVPFPFNNNLFQLMPFNGHIPTELLHICIHVHVAGHIVLVVLDLKVMFSDV